LSLAQPVSPRQHRSDETRISVTNRFHELPICLIPLQCRSPLRLRCKTVSAYFAQDRSCPISERAPKRARTVDATGLTLTPRLLLTLPKQEPHELRADTRSSEQRVVARRRARILKLFQTPAWGNAYEIVEFVPDRWLMMRTAQGPFPMETSYTWVSTAREATRMTVRNRGQPVGFSRLLAPFMTLAMRRANRKDLKLLKTLLERRT
jgi:hypothetical protein